VERLRIATIVGVCGALAVIIGTVLPWVTLTTPAQSYPDPSVGSIPAQSATFNGLFAGNAVMMLLGIAVGIAAAWFWAGDQPRKAVAVLGPVATAVVAFAIWAITAKGQVLGFGSTDTGETASLRVGIYTTLAGGLLALLAAGFAFLVLVRPEDEPIDEPEIGVAGT
jgi:hypothetical protein